MIPETDKVRGAERLIAYRTSPWPPMRLVVAPADRDWMDATPNRFANRCLPLRIYRADRRILRLYVR